MRLVPKFRRRSLPVLSSYVVATTVLLTAGASALPADATSASRGVVRPSAPTALVTNSLPAPMDVDAAGGIELGWQSTLRRQTAYKIELTKPGSGTPLWDTDKVTSARSTAVPYTGPRLRQGERYSWRVKLWDQDHHPSNWSEPAVFGTGPGQWGDSVPIWSAPPAGARWTDYRLDVKLKITRTAMGIQFRSPDARNGYMWQFRASNASQPNTLVPHTQTGGTYKAGTAVPLGVTLDVGTVHAVGIEAVGSTITTSVDGKVVDRRTDTTFADGAVGFRTGGSETGVLDDVTVTSLAADSTGKVLYSNDFNGAQASFPCGTVENQALTIGTSTACLNAVLTNDWALMRHDFSLEPAKKVAWASAFATGSSFDSAKQYVYKMYLDGRFVGLGPTRALGNETRYDGFDVKDALSRPGRHTLSAIAYASKDQRFQAYVIVRYTDGTTQTIGTGPDWKTLSGNEIWTSTGSIGTGYWSMPSENFSAAHYPYGFDKPGFDDTGWSTAVTKKPFDSLSPTPFAKVQEQLHAPAKIVDLGGGDYFVDFGRTWMGGAHLTLDGRAGRQVRLRFGEETSAPNTTRYQLRAGNKYEDVLTLRDGAQTVDTWGMRVFRYMNIVGSPVPITKDNLQALASVYPFDASAARLTSSDPNLVPVWQLSKNTIESANQNFFTDSWTRERTDYEADAYIQLLSNLYLTDDPTLGRYSIDYFENHSTWPTEWPMYVISAVYDTWQRTGSTAQIEHAYDTLVPKLLDKYYDPATGTIVRSDAIVDWPEGERDGYRFTDRNTILNALAYRNYTDMAVIARRLGRDTDAAGFEQKATTLRTALNTRFYQPKQGAYDDGLSKDDVPTGHYAVQASAFPGAFGVPADKAQYDALAKYIASRGMACSVYCSGFLLQALYNAGHGQDALNLLTSSETNSWLHMIELGAGATGEAWDPAQKSNMTWSHPWATAPAYVIPRDMYGIQPTSPGYATFQIAPQTGNQEFGSVTVPSVKGRIGVAFHTVSGRYDLGVAIPGNTTSAVSVPVPGSYSGTTVYLDGRPVTGERAGERVVVQVGAGCHTLSTSASAQAGADEKLTDICRTSS
ncbi:family 78 glycoside hydrolase catalytic domain [Actinoallomurus iriomotensis]|uniref:alpha-L-rhamnosidase n=1 Tax=Actinoallomurus iriomotensis TaxID=478107 RepID=A0A9W6REG6_9ACTN|nr:family 78 glycoside hydrolase catalytic domain [Actinoallomurus iriomotensis]GLY74321.1 hypothetical protein Airi01_025880 [Actinoallomurus iriomotensis]